MVNSSKTMTKRLISFMASTYPMHLIFQLDFNLETGMDSVDVEHYPFDDTNQGLCAFEEMDKLCASADTHLRMDAENHVTQTLSLTLILTLILS